MLLELCTFSDPCLFSTKIAGAPHLPCFVFDGSTNVTGATHLWIACYQIQDTSYGIPLNVTGAMHLCLFLQRLPVLCTSLVLCLMFLQMLRCYAPLDCLLPNTGYLLRNTVKCYWCSAPFLIHVCFLQMLPVLSTFGLPFAED